MRLAFLSTLGLCSALITAVGCAGQGSADTNGGFGGGVLTGAGGAGGEIAATGTGGASSTSSVTAPVCAAGAQQACTCKDDLGATSESAQTCFQDGSAWGECDCPCGDNLCEDNAKENCHTCKADCGVCAPCEYKKCDQAAIPTNPGGFAVFPGLVNTFMVVPREEIATRLQAQLSSPGMGMRAFMAALAPAAPDESSGVAWLRGVLARHPIATQRLRVQLQTFGVRDLPAYVRQFPEIAMPLRPMADLPNGGTTECGEPRLRMRVASITVHEEDDDFANDKVYCVVKAEAQTASEMRVTPVTPPLDEGDSHSFAINDGIFWGQTGPSYPQGPILVTYDCIEQDDNSAYATLLNDLGSASSSIGGIPGMPYGWVFGVAGAVLPAIGSMSALDGDDLLLNAQQTVLPANQLELTQGRWWKVQREGTHTGSDWDWELRVESWGCAQYGVIP